MVNNEDIVDKLSNHDNRLCNLEDYQEKQNGTMYRIEDKLDKVIWALGGGMFAIILMLIRILMG